ncbi:adenosylcobinamide-GDP ribazoletransferase [Ketobacter sp.]|uniref:adenosylcobinamide-GDP ribazoletransferase n=1 Tax=Ketobacter sp. TaxID=2083498 RepID=UPI000F27029E|nr:adenosylcobinamide-GDP ribazoletransferase [Ketobacter sp.]RLU00397.1 MAG: adenosylcobinamide-GDP ribazoletransferase [Ketobacter sp.]
MNPLKIALAFLTRLPVRHVDYNEGDLKASIYWYGVVGLVIGGILWLSQAILLWIAPLLNPAIAAAVLLGVWVLVTGALHLDGLADSADAWLAGGDRERTLAIMKDPRSGPAGVASMVLVLLVKFACLQQLVATAPALLLLAPSLARSLMPILFLHTPYVREAGLATPFRDGLDSATSYLQAALLALMWWWLMGVSALLALLLVGAVFGWLRRLMMQRIGGTTGDTAGACVEILEAVALLGMALAVA